MNQGCENGWCISTPSQPEHGSAHVDATGHVFGRACLACCADLTDRMGVAIMVRRSGLDGWRPAPEDHVLCINCGSNGKNGMTPERYQELTRMEQTA